MTDVDKSKALIRSVLISASEGVPIEKFRHDYEEMAMERLPLFGYKNVEELCHGLKDTIRIQRTSNSTLLFAVSHSSTKHVEALIAKQKKRKPRTVTIGYRSQRNRISLNPRARSSPAPHFLHQQQRVTHHPTSQRNSVDSNRSYESSNRTMPHSRTSTSNQRNSVWNRLGPAPSPPPALRSPSPQRVVTISPIEPPLPPCSPPPPPLSSKSWSVPPNSPIWRHEYLHASTYPISDLSLYGKPGELIYVIGYFKGDRKMEDKVLESGRVLKSNTLQFRIYKSTTPSLPNSILCTFSYPNWAINTYNSPNEIKEGIWVKVYGTYEKSNGGRIAVNFLQVFEDTNHAHTPVAGVETSLSLLSININDSSLNESDGSSSASDTSVYTESESDTTEEDGSRDQGYYSSTVSARVEFPHSSAISLTEVPDIFSSRIKSISNLTHFFLALEDVDDVLETLTNSLTELHQSVKPDNFLIPGACKDLLCSAYNVNTSKWHRAKFLNSYSNGSSTYAVSFIDLGEETQIPVGYIRPFHPEYLQLTAQALPCSLPLPQHMVTDPKLISLFRKLVTNVTLKASVIKRFENKLEVNLTTSEGKNIVSEIKSAFTDNNITSRNISSKLNYFKFNVNTPNQLTSPTKLFIPPSTTPTSTPFTTPHSSYTSQMVLQDRQFVAPNYFPNPGNPFHNTLNPPLTETTAIPGPPGITLIPHQNCIAPAIPRLTLNLGAISNNNLSNGVRPTPVRPPVAQSPIISPFQPMQQRFVMRSCNNSYNPESNSPSAIPPDLQNLVRYETLPIASHFGAVVTAIFSPHRFYVQNCATQSELGKLTSQLQLYGSVTKKTNTTPSPVLEFCLAYSSSKQWARVRVLSVSNQRSEVRVLLLDYGTEEHIHTSNLLKLCPNQFQLPFQAILVKLDKVEPLASGWSDACISRFKDLTLNKDMHAYPKIPFPSIILTDITSRPHIDIHVMLISEGFAAAST